MCPFARNRNLKWSIFKAKLKPGCFRSSPHQGREIRLDPKEIGIHPLPVPKDLGTCRKAHGECLHKQDAGGRDKLARKPLLKNAGVSWEGRKKDTQ